MNTTSYKPLCLRLWLFSAVLAWCAPALAGEAQRNTPQLDLPRVELRAGMHRIDAQVAQTPQTRATGLLLLRSHQILPRQIEITAQARGCKLAASRWQVAPAEADGN